MAMRSRWTRQPHPLSPPPPLTKRRDLVMELIDKVEDEVDRQLLKPLLIDNTEGLTVRHVASKDSMENRSGCIVL